MLLNFSIAEVRGQRAGSKEQGGKLQGFPVLPPGDIGLSSQHPADRENPESGSLKARGVSECPTCVRCRDTSVEPTAQQGRQLAVRVGSQAQALGISLHSGR